MTIQLHHRGSTISEATYIEHLPRKDDILLWNGKELEVESVVFNLDDNSRLPIVLLKEVKKHK